MSDELMFVQFPHPGVEHKPTGPWMDWNRREHARKYLMAEGTYLAEGRERHGKVEFWGEWEPPSRVIETLQDRPAGYPRWLHAPHWDVPRHTRLLQNTDPLVLGRRFLYSNCRQRRNAKLRRLAPGSIVVFGSKLAGEFVMDTVLVVDDDSDSYRPATLLTDDIEKWVRAVVFDPLVRSASRESEFRLYFGRRYSGANDTPFSFVPCLPYDGLAKGFARPALRLPRQWIAPNLAMGAKATPASASELTDLFHEICSTVTTAGLSFGVELQPPSQGHGGRHSDDELGD
jgi:hypothetical protein